MVYPIKVDIVQHWLEPHLVIEDQSSQGLATFYHYFIKGYNMIVTPMTNFLSQDMIVSTPAA